MLNPPRFGSSSCPSTPTQRDSDRLFSQTTAWAELNESLLKIHVRQETLLLVLEHPEIPLHNNLSENDIRQYVKKRKISEGTRSEAGRRARDTFLSLKTTCRKLGHSFWEYLQSRITGMTTVPPLGDLIHQKATAPQIGVPSARAPHPFLRSDWPLVLCVLIGWLECFLLKPASERNRRQT